MTDPFLMELGILMGEKDNRQEEKKQTWNVISGSAKCSEEKIM